MATDINQLPLFCLQDECYSTDLTDDGVCNTCGKANVVSEWSVTISLTAVGITQDEALADLVDRLATSPQDFLKHVTITKK